MCVCAFFLIKALISIKDSQYFFKLSLDFPWGKLAV